MHATLALASLASFATVAFAQTIPGGYGRYPCSQVNEFGDIFAGPCPFLPSRIFLRRRVLTRLARLIRRP